MLYNLSSQDPKGVAKCFNDEVNRGRPPRTKSGCLVSLRQIRHRSGEKEITNNGLPGFTSAAMTTVQGLTAPKEQLVQSMLNLLKLKASAWSLPRATHFLLYLSLQMVAVAEPCYLTKKGHSLALNSEHQGLGGGWERQAGFWLPRRG